jgi:hypothetical protein
MIECCQDKYRVPHCNKQKFIIRSNYCSTQVGHKGFYINLLLVIISDVPIQKEYRTLVITGLAVFKTSKTVSGPFVTTAQSVLKLRMKNNASR